MRTHSRLQERLLYIKIILFLYGCYFCDGDTSVDNVITGNLDLTQGNSPYLAEYGILVAEGGTLTMEAGITVKFPPSRGLEVLGDLVIKGTETEPVTLTLQDGLGSPEMPNNSSRVRLADGAEPGKGVIEMQTDENTWIQLCDPRINNLNQNNDWSGNMAKVVCRELGFATSPKAQLEVSPDPSNNYRYTNYITCNGDEPSLTNCTQNAGSSWCNFRSYRIGVNCGSTYIGAYWGGVYIRSPGNSTLMPENITSLEYVTILGAGIRIIDGEHFLRPALAIHSRNPKLSNIVVRDSAYTGILLENMEHQILGEQLEAINCSHIGIHVTSTREWGTLRGINVQENSNGLVLQHVPDDDFQGIDLCSLTCIRCEYTNTEFPLSFTWDSPRYTNKECEKTFSTDSEHVLVLRPVSGSYGAYVSVRDGRFIDSPIIWQGNIGAGQLGQIMPTLLTETNSLTIRVKDTYYSYYEDHFYFELLSTKPGAYGYLMDDVFAMHNEEAGLNIINSVGLIALSNTYLSDNQHGIYIQKSTANMKMTDSQILGNHLNGVTIMDSDGLYTMENITLTGNTNSSVHYDFSLGCNSHVSSTRYPIITTLFFKNILFSGASDSGITLTTTCPFNLTLLDSELTGLQKGLSLKADNYQSTASSFLGLFNNNFTFHQKNVIVENGRSTIDVKAGGNTFHSNNGHCAWINPTPYGNNNANISFIGNAFINNHHQQASLVAFEYSGIPSGGYGRKVEFKNNTLVNNTVTPPIDYYYYYHESILSAMIYLKTYVNADIRFNVFINPENKAPELSAADSISTISHDARYNFWGNTDVNKIGDLIYGYHHQNIKAKVIFVPYALDDSLSNFTQDPNLFPDFIQGQNIGGIVQEMDIILESSGSPYFVTKDIAIESSGSLIVRPSVTLKFAFRTGIIVHGRLSLEGTADNRITMEPNITPNRNSVVLVGGTPSEGFVHFYHKNKWHHVCYDNSRRPDSKTSNFLCQAAGNRWHEDYEGRVGTVNVLRPDALESVSCADNQGRIEHCDVEETNLCSTGELLYLECSPSNWAGIHLAVDAMASMLSYVTLTHIDDSEKRQDAAVQIDFMIHNIMNMAIDTPDDTNFIGMQILLTDHTMQHYLNQISISNYDTAVSITTSGLSFDNLNLSHNAKYGSHTGIDFATGLSYISTLTESILKPVCRLETIHLNRSQAIIIRMNDDYLQYGQMCSAVVSTDDDSLLALQHIAGSVSPYCMDDTLKFYNGNSSLSNKTILNWENEFIWTSIQPGIEVIMHRTYHSYRRCMDITIRISSYKADTEIREKMSQLSDVRTTGFYQSVVLNNIWDDVFIKDSSFIDSDYIDIHINSGGGSLHISNSSFLTDDYGIYSNWYQGNISVESCFFNNTDRMGIYMAYGNGNLQMSNSSFLTNEYGVYTNRYHGNIKIQSCSFNNSRNAACRISYGYYGAEYLKLTVNQTLFESNSLDFQIYREKIDQNYKALVIIEHCYSRNAHRLANIHLFSRNTQGNTTILINNNFFEHFDRGILTSDTDNDHVLFWQVHNNTFQFGRGPVLDIMGSGTVSDNDIFENYGPITDKLIRITSYNPQCHWFTKGNQITNNAGYTELLSIFGRCNIEIHNNDILNNTILNSIIHLVTFRKLPQTLDVTSNNMLKNKDYSDCENTSAIIIQMTGKFSINQNVFFNPDLHNEIMVHQRSLSDQSEVDASHNFWGTADKNIIKSRIYDGMISGFVPIINISPIYTDKEKSSLINITADYTLPSENLGGYVEKSVEILTGTHYKIIRSLVVPRGITFTVPEGSQLCIMPAVDVIIYGKIIIEGGDDEPIHIKPCPEPTSITAPSVSTDETCDNFKVRLEYDTNVYQGAVQIRIGSTWISACRSTWNRHNSDVACRELGFGSANGDVLNYGYRGEVSHYEFMCRGSEARLANCPKFTGYSACPDSSSFGIICSPTLMTGAIHFASRSNNEVSILSNVLLKNVVSIHVTGTPPLFQNVTLQNTEDGFIFVGAGIAKEMDIFMNNVTVKMSKRSGVALYDITSNVTLEHMSINNTTTGGIVFSPTIHDGLLLADHLRSPSSFTFCDVEGELFVEPGEEYKFFGGAGLSYACRRVFKTETTHSIQIYMKSELASYSQLLIADFFEGREGQPQNRISQFFTIRGGIDRQVITVESLGSIMATHLAVAESLINYASVASIPRSLNDCSFEDGWCGWQNADDMFSTLRTKWTIYNCSSGLFNYFGGLERDVTFSNGLEGHYMVATEFHNTTCYSCYDSNPVTSTDALLESPILNQDGKLCGVSFYYYRLLATRYDKGGGALALYYKTSGGKLIELESFMNDVSSWRYAYADLSIIPEGNFQLYFNMKLPDRCQASAGIDDLKFFRCPEEKLVSTIAIKTSDIQNVQGSAISIFNSDPEKHNVIWMERTSIHDSRGSTILDPSVKLVLKSAYVLIRNTNIMRTTGYGIDILFDSVTMNRVSEASVVQNSLQYINSGYVLNHKNTGVNEAILKLNGNDIRHNSAGTIASVITILNTSLIMSNNILHNNTGKYILELGSETQHIGNTAQQLITNNTFWYNLAQKPAATYTIWANTSKLTLWNNVLQNPSNSFEFSSTSGTPDPVTIDCTNNWWGTGLVSSIPQKVRHGGNTQGLATVSFIPFLTHPPSYFGFSGACPLGWNRLSTRCLMYKTGATSYSEAVETCSFEGAGLLSTSLAQRYTDYVDSVTAYTDLDGIDKNTNIWIQRLDSESSVIYDVAHRSTCIILHPERITGLQHTTNAPCTELHPFICQKLSTVRCKNSCFQNGLCSGLTCLCNDGWQGDDCSVYHCKDMNACSGHGECVGPNICKCQDGWQGRACSTSFCPRYKDCHTCSKRSGCGWCDFTLQCLPGNAFGPDTSACTHWFFHNCLTMEESEGCSNNIGKIQCRSRYCNNNLTDSNRGTCQGCTDIQRCYINNTPGGSTCLTWDETQCPGGIVKPDYTDSTRIDNTIIKDNIHIIDPSELLIYACPVLFTNDTDDERFLFIINKPVTYDIGDIIASAQSGGILHSVNSSVITNAGPTLIVGKPVKIEDVIQYADFSQEISMEELIDDITNDQVPSSSLVENLVNGTLNISDDITLHTIPGSIDILKCIGHQYSIQGGTERVFSQYVVLPLSSGANLYNVGDFVLSASSSTFLESINNITSNSLGLFAYSQLTQCSSAISNPLPLRLDLTPSDLNCFAGDGWSGLHYYENLAGDRISKGDMIPGRQGGMLLGHIISKVIVGDYVLLEYDNVDGFENGRFLALSMLYSLDDSSRLRSKRAYAKFTALGSRGVIFSKEGKGVTASVSGLASYSMGMKLTLKVDWGFFNSKLMEAGFTLSGEVSGKFEGSVSAALSTGLDPPLEGPIYDKRIQGKTFYLLVVGIAIPGRIFFDFTSSYHIGISAKGTLLGSYSITGEYQVGSTWRRGKGSRVTEHPLELAQSKRLEATVEGKAFVTIHGTPSVVVQWPLLFSSKDTPRGPDLSLDDDEKKALNPIPAKLRWYIEFGFEEKSGEGSEERSEENINVEVAVRDELTSLEISLSFPFSVGFTGSFCDKSCNNPEKLTKVYLGGKLDSVQLAFSALAWKIALNIPIKGVGLALIDTCYDNFIPCCYCLSGGVKPGKIDNETNVCECPCYCDPPTNKIVSTKDANGECECEKCPDGTIKRYHDEIQCPCPCADGTFREMRDDQSCSCEGTCPDGSKDEIAADGFCPCQCECKNCETSTIGPNGCECPNDICPVCEEGTIPQWKDCICECESPECGLLPICAAGRTGPQCDQLHCPACQDCSGNGVCSSTTGSCDSSCQCSRQWEGLCCENRRPRGTWGDPHLETLDGYGFDYFGIGQFWDCKSEDNDFGFQVRYFHFQNISFTGAIAVKAGPSIVTVTTPTVGTSEPKPALRVDGDVQETETPWSKRLGNDILLDVKPKNATEEDKVVLRASFEFRKGLSIGIDVRISPQLKRLFLNIQLTLNKDFKHKTSGLCGIMDDDMSNDLTGPDGTIYNDTSKFAESWRIPQLIRQGAGVQNSWSWTESNFHPDDNVDITYTNPFHQPSYVLTANPQLLQTATDICTNMGLNGLPFDNCMFDLMMTNDTTIFDQDTLKIGCPGQCSGKGRCVNDTCSCLDGWSGEDCHIGTCGDCYQGECLSGFCKCDIGWEGADCSTKATCHNVNNCTDLSHGQCLVTDKCLCIDGFIGDDCSIIPTCNAVNNCSLHGICIDYDVCKCDLGWQGNSCDDFSCEKLDFCSKHGICVNLDVCLCDVGWTGRSCALPDCSSVNGCSGHGRCVDPAVCSCSPGFIGTDCSQLEKCPQLDNCNDHGICVIDELSANQVCSCDLDYSGTNCSEPLCDKQNGCSGNGLCTEPNLCQCYAGYEGQNCDDFSCETKDKCSGHGNCTELETCTCDAGWSGESCQIADCSDVNECSLQGDCIAPNQCACYEGLEGDNCSQPLGPNDNSPVFAQSEYTVLISEDTEAGNKLISVSAIDKDSGRNGQVQYIIDTTGDQLDIGSFLTIDSDLGDVYLIKEITRVDVPSGELKVTVVAADQGSPSQSATTVLTITVQDVNDHCPIIISPEKGTTIYVNASVSENTEISTVTATDEDFDENGQVEYKFDTTMDRMIESLINIDPFFGNMTTIVSPLPVGTYKVDVIARDLGSPPCSKKIRVTMSVFPAFVAPLIEISTTTTTTTTTTELPTTPVVETSDSSTSVGIKQTGTLTESSTDVTSILSSNAGTTATITSKETIPYSTVEITQPKSTSAVSHESTSAVSQKSTSAISQKSTSAVSHESTPANVKTDITTQSRKEDTTTQGLSIPPDSDYKTELIAVSAAAGVVILALIITIGLMGYNLNKAKGPQNVNESRSQNASFAKNYRIPFWENVYN